MSESDLSTPPVTQTAVCAGCGMQTNSPELLVSRRKHFRLKRGLYCHSCQVDSAKGVQRTTWGIWLLYGVIMLVVAMSTSKYEMLGNYLQTLVIVIILAPLTVICHELGHAFVAWTMGWQVYAVVLGVGRVLWQGRIRDTLLQIRVIQLGGSATTFPDTYGFWYRPQAFLMVLGGPVANFVAGIIGVIFLLFTEPGGVIPWRTIWGFWIFLNIFMGLINLIPLKVLMHGITQGSDGLQLFWILFRPKFYRERSEYSRSVSRFATLRQMGEHERARAEIADLAARMPEDLLALLNLSAAEVEVKNYAAAIATAERGLELIKRGVGPSPFVTKSGPQFQPKFFEAGFKDNIASAMLESGTGDPAAALKLAREVYEIVPWSPEVQASYGYALGLTGSPAEGYELLAKANKKLTDQPQMIRDRIKAQMAEIELLKCESASEISSTPAGV